MLQNVRANPLPLSAGFSSELHTSAQTKDRESFLIDGFTPHVPVNGYSFVGPKSYFRGSNVHTQGIQTQDVPSLQYATRWRDCDALQP